jgi:hypothetical protein
MGRISGEPKVKAVDDWLRIESKLTGLCFQPVGDHELRVVRVG